MLAYSALHFLIFPKSPDVSKYCPQTFLQMSPQPGATCATSCRRWNTCILVVLCTWIWNLLMSSWLPLGVSSWETSDCSLSWHTLAMPRRGKWKTTCRKVIPGTWPPSSSEGNTGLQRMFSGMEGSWWNIWKVQLIDYIQTDIINVFPLSLGVTILELACNIEVPNGGEGWQQLRQGCLPSEFTSSRTHLLFRWFVSYVFGVFLNCLFTFAGLSGELQSVLQMMLNPEPSERPTVSELLGLPSVWRYRWKRRVYLTLTEAAQTLASICQVRSCTANTCPLYLGFYACLAWGPQMSKVGQLIG